MKEFNQRKKTTKRYWPLITLVVIAMLGSMALVSGNRQGLFAWMHYFMGFFFCQFAMLKLFNLSGFAEGFRMYDLIAKSFPGYATIYPFIELGLGLSYLSFAFPTPTYIVTIIVMWVGVIGVVKALRQGLDVRCACMGTVLDVPLSTVTLSEDIAMGAMAALMLVSTLF